jgi:type IV pilus assembly protein PilF
MNKYRLCWIVLGVVMVFAMSCAANRQVNKKQSEALRNLGEVYLNQGDYTAALKEFLKAESFDPDDPFLHYDLGLTYKAKKELDLAVKHFKKAIKLKPDYSPAKNGLGTVYLDQKEWDKAVPYLKAAKNNLLYATPYIPLSNLGWAYYNKKEYTTAEKYYLDALDINPKFINALRGLGLTYMALGKVPEAIEILERAIKKYPRFALFYLDLGRAYTVLHDDERARDAYQKVVELAPDNALSREAKKALSKIERLQ